MPETLMWILMLVIEVLLLGSGMLGFLLWRARRVQRRLRAEIAELQRAGQEGTATAPSLPPLPLPPPTPLADAALAETAEAPPNTANLSHVITMLDDRSMDESMGRLEETKKGLLQHVEVLQTQRALAQQDQQSLATLRHTFKKMEEELETLRYAYTRLQRELQNKKLLIERTIAESQLLYMHRSSLQHTVRELRITNTHLSGDIETKDRLLQGFKVENQTQQHLRGEVHTLKTTLAAREADVARLQAEKDVLVEESTALSKEYERIYASFVK